MLLTLVDVFVLDVPFHHALDLTVQSMGTEEMKPGWSYQIILYVFFRDSGDPSLGKLADIYSISSIQSCFFCCLCFGCCHEVPGVPLGRGCDLFFLIWIFCENKVNK